MVSYGQIAASIAAPRSARQVGWTMRELGSKAEIPWWRVINNQGKITIKGWIINDAEIQRKLLLAEGAVAIVKLKILYFLYQNQSLLSASPPPSRYSSDMVAH